MPRRRPIRPRHLPHAPLYAAIVALVAMLTGCVGYNVYPPVEGVDAFADPNDNNARLVMQHSLEWLVRHYPPGTIDRPDFTTDYAINLPAGVRKSRYDIIAYQLGPKAFPITPEVEDLPIYHVARIWIRGDAARVELLRPTGGWGTARPTYQGVTTKLRGGVNQWHVTSHQGWSPGAMEIPQLNYALDPEPEPAPDADAPRAPTPRTGEPDALWEPAPIIEDSRPRSIRETPVRQDEMPAPRPREDDPQLPPGVIQVPN